MLTLGNDAMVVTISSSMLLALFPFLRGGLLLSNFGVQKKAKIWGPSATERVLTDNLDVQTHKVSEVPPSFPISPLQEVPISITDY